MSYDQGAWDAIGRSVGEARSFAVSLLVQHLVVDHGWSVRKVARRLGVREKWVREQVATP